VDLARVLVERGFTVALPQHAGDNFEDNSEPGPTSWVRRPVEVSQAIDRVAADDRLAQHLRLDAVGVFGGSAGGHTALSLAGGEWSPSRFRDHCLLNIDQDFSSCVGFVTVRRGDGLDAIKTWAAKLVIRLRFSDDTPQRHTDPRIGAVVAMVPFAADFDPESLRRPIVPLGLVIADQDVNQVPRFHVEPVRAACEPRCQVLTRLKEGGHGAMLSPLPPFESGSVAQRLLDDPPSFNRAAAMPALHAGIAGFFVRHLGSGLLGQADQVQGPCREVAAEHAIDSGKAKDEQGRRDDGGVQGVHDCVNVLREEDGHDHGKRDPAARNEVRLRGCVVADSPVAKHGMSSNSGDSQCDGP
jgi:hypothetical protein